MKGLSFAELGIGTETIDKILLWVIIISIIVVLLEISRRIYLGINKKRGKEIRMKFLFLNNKWIKEIWIILFVLSLMVFLPLTYIFIMYLLIINGYGWIALIINIVALLICLGSFAGEKKPLKIIGVILGR